MTPGRAPLSINFASRDYRLLSRIYSGLLAGSAALLLALAVLIRLTVISHADAAGLAQRISELSARDEEIKPVLLEREKLLKDIATMSALIEFRRFSWTRLLTHIETVFPVGVALERVGYNPKEMSLDLDGRAQSPEALRNLITGMERAAVFKAPFLKHQSLDKGAISFAVGVKYHEDRSAGLAQNK